MKHDSRCNIICSHADCICRMKQQGYQKPSSIWKILAFIAILLSLSLVLFAQDSIKIVIRKVHTAEDYFQVEAYHPETKAKFFFTCECKDRIPKPKKGDTVLIKNPIIKQF